MRNTIKISTLTVLLFVGMTAFFMCVVRRVVAADEYVVILRIIMFGSIAPMFFL